MKILLLYIGGLVAAGIYALSAKPWKKIEDQIIEPHEDDMLNHLHVVHWNAGTTKHSVWGTDENDVFFYIIRYNDDVMDDTIEIRVNRGGENSFFKRNEHDNPRYYDRYVNIFEKITKDVHQKGDTGTVKKSQN